MKDMFSCTNGIGESSVCLDWLFEGDRFGGGWSVIAWHDRTMLWCGIQMMEDILLRYMFSCTNEIGEASGCLDLLFDRDRNGIINW